MQSKQIKATGLFLSVVSNLEAKKLTAAIEKGQMVQLKPVEQLTWFLLLVTCLRAVLIPDGLPILKNKLLAYLFRRPKRKRKICVYTTIFSI